MGVQLPACMSWVTFASGERMRMMQSSGIELTRSSRNQVLRQCFAISRGSRMMSSAKLSAIIPSMHLQLLSIIVHIIIIIVVIIIIFSVIVIVIRIIVIVIISIVVVIISIIVVIITIIIYLCMYASICFSTLYKELHIIQARKRQKEKEKREMNRKWEGVERERKRETQGQEVESEEGTHRSLFQC